VDSDVTSKSWYETNEGSKKERPNVGRSKANR